MTTIKEITINDFYYTDIVPVTITYDTNTQYSDRDHLVDGISIMYAENIFLNNINGKYNKFPVIYLSLTRKVSIDGLEVNMPDLVAGGEGYGVQSNSSLFVEANKLGGVNFRHLIDFTQTGYATVTNSRGIGRAIVFSQHGKYDHDIIFKDCQGSFQLDNGGTDYGKASMNITLDNCDGSLYFNYSDNLKIINCDDITLTNKLPRSGYINNSKVKYTTNTLYSDLRGQSISNLYIKSSWVTKSGTPTQACSLYNFENVTFEDSYYSNCPNEDIDYASAVYQIVIKTAKFRFVRGKTNMSFIFSPVGLSFCKYLFKDIDYRLKSNYGFRIKDTSNAVIDITIDGNTFTPLTNGLYISRMPDSYSNTSTHQAVKFINNTILNDYTTLLQFNYNSGDKFGNKSVYDNNFVPSTCAVTLNGGATTIGTNISY